MIVHNSARRAAQGLAITDQAQATPQKLGRFRQAPGSPSPAVRGCNLRKTDNLIFGDLYGLRYSADIIDEVDSVPDLANLSDSEIEALELIDGLGIIQVGTSLRWIIHDPSTAEELIDIPFGAPLLLVSGSAKQIDNLAYDPEAEPENLGDYVEPEFMIAYKVRLL